MKAFLTSKFTAQNSFDLQFEIWLHVFFEVAKQLFNLWQCFLLMNQLLLGDFSFLAAFATLEFEKDHDQIWTRKNLHKVTKWLFFLGLWFGQLLVINKDWAKLKKINKIHSITQCPFLEIFVQKLFLMWKAVDIG